MKNYSEITATSALVQVRLTLLNRPEYRVWINGIEQSGTDMTLRVALDSPFAIEVELLTKDYQAEETAVIVNSIQVDGIELIPEFDHLAVYDNDHNYTAPTSYVGFVGRWTLDINRPFYQWLHQATGQGWLISPLK